MNTNERIAQAEQEAVKHGMTFVGGIESTTKRELIPNETNPALADVARVTIWAGMFKYGRRKFMFVFAREYERIEIGTYRASAME